ncbi:MAG: Mannosylglycerate hydrolase [Chloroflexi bacterium ADurb.Bin180]|nr:MAG: Mannosylglycerate hydrolase [Chloroflexi bacterium ADurb.Bin180]
MTRTAFVVSHTHWDREWYETYQQFRLRLVRLMDKLLHILETDAAYRFFMLDGQTIVLEDYLQIRPQRENDLRRHIQSGRLLIGPWHVLPDEFLVSGEALVRNLLLGHRTCARFGGEMRVGYIPDPFGHISQMPQILRGFGLASAALRRGLDDHPTELLWQSPDGSSVLLCYLRDGYDNAARLPVQDGDAFVREVRRLAERLAPFCTTDNVLLMNGVDHMEPVPELPAMMAYAGQAAPDLRLLHSTLPAYVDAVTRDRGGDLSTLTTVKGELRSPRRHHLLPGVLSTRMWIKQRNGHVQNLLSYWAEPFSAWAAVAGGDVSAGWLRGQAVWQAWRYLLENHPHDSICGCGIDQVHREMATRFDWAEQIAEQVSASSLATLAEEVDTTVSGAASRALAVVVFNPLPASRTEVVTVDVQLPGSLQEFVVLSADGQVVPHQAEIHPGTEYASMQFGRDELVALPDMVTMLAGLGLSLQEVEVRKRQGGADIDVTLMKGGVTEPELLDQVKVELAGLLADSTLQAFSARAHLTATATVHFLARDVPGCGYSTYYLRPAQSQHGSPVPDHSDKVWQLENEFVAATIDPEDGTVCLRDKTTGVVFAGLNRFVDGGDRGDEYNYCAPEADLLVSASVRPPRLEWIEQGPARWCIRVTQEYQVPVSLSADRASRSEETILVPIQTEYSLSPGARRLDVRTEVENRVQDHRLSAVFPTPVRTAWTEAESTFDVVRRPIALPADTADWVEQPVNTHPQGTFVDASDGLSGLMVANRGLPEFGAQLDDQGRATLAVTLLRCVGWLSRDDMSCRQGHAGPALETPEAQCPGRHVFEYALIPHQGNWQTCHSEALAFNLPLRAVQTTVHAGALPASGGFLTLEGEGLVLSAVKAAEDGSGLVIRVYNPLVRPVAARLSFLWPVESASLVDLKEDNVRELALDSADAHVLRFVLKGKEIGTVRVRLHLDGPGS